MQTKAVLYCRVSSKEQEETGYSLPAQEKYLREYARRSENNFDIVKAFQVSESAGGKVRRKIFGEMMEFIKKNGVSIVVVETTDRLTRNFADVPEIDAWVLGDESHQIHLAKEGSTLHKNSKSHEWFMWRVKVAAAEYYVKLLSENVLKGQKEKLEQGGLPATSPIGYMTVGEHGRKTHVIDPNKAPFVKRAFELYATGNYSLKTLKRKLYEEGFRSRSGGVVHKSRIEAMLKEPFYYGAMRWRGAIYPKGGHTPLISKELFDKVQEEIKRGGLKYRKHSFTFKKVLTCIECGGSVTGEVQKGHVYYDGNHEEWCSVRGMTREEVIENQLLGVFKLFESITSEEAEEVKETIKANHAEEAAYKEKALKELTERYERLGKRLDVLYDDHLDQAISREMWMQKQSGINAEQAEILEQIKRIKSEETKYFEIGLNILDLARRACEIYENENRTPEERRLLLTHIFETIMLGAGGKVQYTLKAPVAKIAKRVQEKLDAEIFEPTQNALIRGTLSSRTSAGHSGARSAIRTSQNGSAKARTSSSTNGSRSLLAWVDAFRTYKWEDALPAPEGTIRQIKDLIALA